VDALVTQERGHLVAEHRNPVLGGAVEPSSGYAVLHLGISLGEFVLAD
jgi:hypothetical protein